MAQPNFNPSGVPIVASPADALINNSFNVQLFLRDQVDIQHTPVYDSLSYAVATTVTVDNSFFFTSVGPGSSKTKAQTNMTQSQKLAAPEAFSILGFRLKWNENIFYTDAINLFANMAYNFTINTKSYQLAPLWHFNAGGGLLASGLITSTTAGLTQVTNLTSITNGVPARSAMHTLALPLPLENQVSFAASLVGTTVTLTAGASGGTGLYIQSLLDGLYARAIQ